MRIFTIEQIRKIKMTAIAEKHNCSASHVKKLLAGDRNGQTNLGKAIIDDCKKILEVLEG